MVRVGKGFCRRTLLPVLLAAGTTAAVTSVVFSQTGTKEKPAGQPAAQPDMQLPPEMMEFMSMMEAWARDYGDPGPEHAVLADSVGKWRLASKMWMKPGLPAMESGADIEIESVFNGRYFLERMKGDPMMGMPGFEGLNIMGYDRFTKKYFFVWADSMSTCIFHGEGTASPDGKVITYMAKGPDPETLKLEDHKCIVTHVDKDHMTFEMQKKSADGTWWTHFEGKYTRVK